MLKAIRFIFLTEILLLLRRSQEWLYPLGFFFIVICLFPLAFTPDPAFLQKYMPGAVWIAALLASLLSIANVFQADMEEGHMEQLFLSQLPLPLVMLVKLCAQWIMTELPLILLTPLLGLFFGLSAYTIFVLSCSLLVGTPILTLMGSQCVALTLGLRQQGMLLGLLVFPLVIPVLIFGVNIVQQSAAGLSVTGPFAFLAGLCIFTVTVLPMTIALSVGISMDD